MEDCHKAILPAKSGYFNRSTLFSEHTLRSNV
jgi:hypothetical protein